MAEYDCKLSRPLTTPTICHLPFIDDDGRALDGSVVLLKSCKGWASSVGSAVTCLCINYLQPLYVVFEVSIWL